MPTRKTTEASLPRFDGQHHQRASVEALLASIGEGIIATDVHGRITQINRVGLEILGYKEKQLLGKWFPEVIVALRQDGSMIDIMDRPIEKVFLTGKTVSDQVYYMTAQGYVIPIALTVSPIMVHSHPVGAIQAFRDISIEIQSDKAKTEFISIASHQLRTPLTAVNMYAQMLNSGIAGKMTATQRSYLDIITAAVARMNDLINTLLNITRIEAGSITVEPHDTDVVQLGRDLITELTPESQRKHIALEFNAPKTPIIVQTDELLMREVCSNLLSNALKFTRDKGTVRFQIYVDRHNVIFKVKDTGFGIPQAAQAHIFTKFFRADNVISQDVSGTGLGLYLTKIIAENLGGDMWFESKERRGSTFYFALPLGGSIGKQGKFRLDI